MKTLKLTDRKIPFGDLLENAPADGVLIKTKGHLTYALMPLDDNLLDYLLERDPKFIAECRAISKRMKSGQRHSHAEVLKLFKR